MIVIETNVYCSAAIRCFLIRAVLYIEARCGVETVITSIRSRAAKTPWVRDIHGLKLRTFKILCIPKNAKILWYSCWPISRVVKSRKFLFSNKNLGLPARVYSYTWPFNCSIYITLMKKDTCPVALLSKPPAPPYDFSRAFFDRFSSHNVVTFFFFT